MILFYSCIGLMFSVLVFGIIFTIAYDKKREVKVTKEATAWLEENKDKKAWVEFGVGNRTYTTHVYKAEIDIWGDDWDGTSARTKAERELKSSYRNGYFTDKDGMTYPTCNVTHASIVEG